MRVVAWNCNGATSSRANWDYLLQLQPDIALLQEVVGLPDSIKEVYESYSKAAVRKDGRNQRFETVVLSKRRIRYRVSLISSIPWVERELNWFSGNLVTCDVDLVGGLTIRTVSVYSPAWPVDRARLMHEDVLEVRLKENRDVWVADLLWASLKETIPRESTAWVIAGDFNSSETFDLWPGGPRGNREYLDRMKDLGLTECLRYSKGELTPTYLNKDGRTIKHQMDHMFVTADLGSALIRCDVGSEKKVFQLELSDHLPIIADFRME